MQYKFTDKLILKDIKFDTDMPDKVKKGGIAIGLHEATKTTYKGHVLSDGDLIRSAVIFRLADKVIAGVTTVNQPVVGILKQDHTGTVIDVTTDDLTDLEKEQMALKQAKMLLSSCDITKIQSMENPAIVITGNGDADAKQADRVWAALLLLKRDNPSFHDIPIEAYIINCKRPVFGPTIFSSADHPTTPAAQALADDAYIKKHLTTALINEGIGEKLGLEEFTAVKNERKKIWNSTKNQLEQLKPRTPGYGEQMKLFKAKLNQLAGDAADIKDNTRFGFKP